MPTATEVPITARQEIDALLKGIQSHALWVSLSVSRPRMNYQISDATVSIATDQGTTQIDNEMLQSPRWKLLPDESNDKFNHLESAARRTLAGAALAFPAIKGITLLPITRASEVFQGLRRINGRFDRERQQFIEGYDQLLKDLQSKLTAVVYNKIKYKLPAKERLTSLFRIRIMTLPIGGGSTSIDQEKLAKVIELVHDAGWPGVVEGAFVLEFLKGLQQQRDEVLQSVLDQEAMDLVSQADQELRRSMSQFLAHIADEPAKAVTEALTNLISSLRDEKIIRAGTLSQAERAFKLAEGFSFLRPDVPALILQGRQMLTGVTSRELNADKGLGKQLADALLPLVAQISRPDVVKESVQNFRRISLNAAKLGKI